MKTEHCIFCDIVARTQPAHIVHETDEVLAFQDIRPRAPVHLLIIPKIHIATLNDILPEHQPIIGEMFWVAKFLPNSSTYRKQAIVQSSIATAMRVRRFITFICTF